MGRPGGRFDRSPAADGTRGPHRPRRRVPHGGRQRLVERLGALDGLILENHGPLVVGRTVAEAWMLMHMLERAAQAQLRAMAAAGGQVDGVRAALAELTYRRWVGDGSERDGDVEWPALLRRLDRVSPGYRD